MADKTAQTIYIDADPSTVMDVIADIGSYPDWVAEYKETEVLEADAEGYPKTARLVLDAEVPLASLTYGLMNELDKLEPYGAGNPKPKFLASGLKVESPRLIGKEEVKKHLDFRVRQGGTSIRCVAWNMADRMEELMSAGGDCCLAFTPKINEWNGNRRIQLQIVDLKPGRTVELG